VPTPKLFVRDKHNNTVLNWHGRPDQEFHLYGEAFWNAAKRLLQNDALDRCPGASFDAGVVVYLYRHALELFLKAILIGRGRELVDAPPPPKGVVDRGHSLTGLLPDVRRIFGECGWDRRFGTKTVVTFDDFEAIVKELEEVDQFSFSFRYPVNKNLSAALDDHFTFSLRQFTQTMDEVISTLYDACYVLPNIADQQAEAACEASRDAMQDNEPPDYEPR
jgi:hypothetical protein